MAWKLRFEPGSFEQFQAWRDDDPDFPCPILDEEPEVPIWLQGAISDYFTLRASSSPDGPIRMVDYVAYAGVLGISREAWPRWLTLMMAGDQAWAEAQVAKQKKPPPPARKKR